MSLQPKQTNQQRLLLAPNVTMALEILRMPTLELRAFLEHQLEENPLLELDVEAAPEPETAPETDPAPEAPNNGLDEDWTSHWRTGAEREAQDEDDGRDERMTDIRLLTAESLYESLKLQLGCQPLSDEERRIGEFLIHHLNDYGYLETALDEVAGGCAVPVAEVERVLKLIQRLEPAGVGARDLRECLMLQLEQQQATEGLAYRILRDHFTLFVTSRLGAISRATRATADEVAKACAQLKQLNPKPGRAFASDLPPSMVPDLIIRHREKHYDVELNDQEIPRVSVSRAYHRMLKDPRTPEDAKEFLAEKFRRASWLIKAIDERNATLLAIARCLISLQREFLEHGPKALKPLTQSQVAGLIGRHPSTVSRAISGKTIDSPYGVFRLEQLFASSVPQHHQSEGTIEQKTATNTNGDGALSDAHIKAELQRLVAEEDVARPLSDAAIMQRLAERKILVARRTIAKYRTALNILPAHLRKRQA